MATHITLAERKSSRADNPRNPYPLNDAEDSESLAFGVGPLRPIGAVAAEVVADLRFRRKVQRLHGLGPRILAELLAEIAAERGIATIVNQKLDTYVDLDPTAIEAAGGDGFWPVPVREA